MKKNIILIGFMGVGKGTIARELVKRYSYFAIDSDDIIESIENRKIKDIFTHDGEPYFRALEQKCANWIEQNIKSTIVSVGGGFYNVKNLNKLGVVIHLNASFEYIYQGLLNSPNAKRKLKKRPLFQNLSEAKKLYKKRVPIYKELSDYNINTEQKSYKEIAKEIQKIINNL